jgi:SAM-dependent methyltransferase
MPRTPADRWASGAAYDPYVGRWSHLVAREFVRWLGVAPGAHWIDVGCGTGALTSAVLGVADPARAEGADRSAAYALYAHAQLRDARASFLVADALALPFPAACADAAVSGLVLNFVPEPGAMLAEMRRVVRRGGVVAAYVWDYAEGMQLMRYFWDAAVVLDAAAAPLDEGRRFPLCEPAALAALFRDAGLRAVATREVVVPTRFATFDDYWAPFLGGQGPAPSYVASLDADARAALRELLRRRVPADSSGAIGLTARAWAVRGERPPD